MAQTSNCSAGPDRSRCCDRAAEVLEPEFFRALCDPTRLSVLLRLAEIGGPAPVSEVASCCTVDLSVVSRHLAALRRAGIVSAERRGKEVRHRVRFSALAATLRRMADAVEACCPTAIPEATTEPNLRPPIAGEEAAT